MKAQVATVAKIALVSLSRNVRRSIRRKLTKYNSVAAGNSSTVSRIRAIRRDMPIKLSPQPHEQDNQVNHEQHYDGQFENEHRAVVLVGPQDLVEAVQRLEFFVDGAVPVGQVEAVGQALVDARQVPVAEKLGDVGQLIGEARQVDADLAQLALDGGGFAATQRGGGGEVAIGAVDRRVQQPVVRLQLRQLEVGQLHDVQHFVEAARVVDDQGGVPVDDHQIP